MRGARLLLAVGAIGLGLGWILSRGLSTSLVYFKTPTEVLHDGAEAVGDQLRLGGQVVPGSAQETPGGVRFVLTDGTSRMTVVHRGEVPALFPASMGVVVEGRYGTDGVFHADTVLIKHSEVYTPPRPGETPHSAELEASG